MALSGKPFDRFTIVHAGFGVWAGARGFGFWPTLVMHTIWEIFECYVMERANSDQFVFSRERFANRIGDTLACLADWSMNLNDRLKADPWVGNVNPKNLLFSKYTLPVSGLPKSGRR